MSIFLKYSRSSSGFEPVTSQFESRDVDNSA